MKRRVPTILVGLEQSLRSAPVSPGFTVRAFVGQVVFGVVLGRNGVASKADDPVVVAAEFVLKEVFPTGHSTVNWRRTRQ